MGERSDHRFPSEESVGGLPAADVHDVGCWSCGGQSGERLAGVAASWPAVPLERQAVAQGDRLRATAAAASTLAYRCFLHQPVWDLLLPVQRSGWLQSFDRALGSAGVDEGSRRGTNSGTRQGEVSAGQTADDFRQRAAVHRSRLQGVHSHLGDDARAYLALLSAVEWQDRTLAQVAQAGMYPAAHAADSGRCAALDSSLCGSLQHGASAQRDRVCDPADMLLGRQAEIHAERDRKLEQARRLRQLRRQQVATFLDSPSTMTSPEETEAGSAGRQPC